MLDVYWGVARGRTGAGDRCLWCRCLSVLGWRMYLVHKLVEPCGVSVGGLAGVGTITAGGVPFYAVKWSQMGGPSDDRLPAPNRLGVISIVVTPTDGITVYGPVAIAAMVGTLHVAYAGVAQHNSGPLTHTMHAWSSSDASDVTRHIVHTVVTDNVISGTVSNGVGYFAASRGTPNSPRIGRPGDRRPCGNLASGGYTASVAPTANGEPE